jgi:signal transduction histidine kinase
MTLVILLILALAGLAIKLIRDKKTIAEQRFLLEQEKVEKLKKESILIATQAVLSGEEIERRRLARDLHDGLGGMLSGIKLKLSNIKGTFVLDKESAKNFDNAIQGLDASVKEMRRVAHNLMPEVLVKYGLKEAINDFCSEFDASANKKLKFRFYGIPQRIDQNKEIGVYRIMQELVNNAIKHAEAGNILVQLVQETYRLSLTVQDNGKGFNVKIIDECKSVGLNSIKTRVKSLNGILDINSTPGKGTEIEVEFNL